MNNTAYAFTGWRRVAATALIFTAALLAELERSVAQKVQGTTP